MTREICKLCGRISAVGFSVPEEMWEYVTQGRWNVLCLACFSGIADELLVPWDQDIEFFPVSRYTFDNGNRQPEGVT